MVSVSVLNVFATTWGKDTTALLFRGLSDFLKDTRYGQNIAEYISLSEDIRVGDHFTDFEQPIVHLSEFKWQSRVSGILGIVVSALPCTSP